MENDKIVVWCKPELLPAIRQLLLKFEHLISDSGVEQGEQLVRREITLNGPDTENYSFFVQLMVLGASPSFYAAKSESSEGVR